MTTTDEQQGNGAFGVSSPEPVSARQVVNEMVEAGLLDDVMDRAAGGGLALTVNGCGVTGAAAPAPPLW